MADEKLSRKDPDYYSKLAKRSWADRKKRGHYRHFEHATEEERRRLGAEGGRKSKRVKVVEDADE